MRFLMLTLVLVSSLLAAQEWDSSLDTARGVDYLNEREKDVIFEMNKIRAEPARWATEVLVPLRELYQGYIIQRPGEIALRTQEGVAALNEAIRVLQQHPGGLQPLVPSLGMSKAAQDHADDQARSGRVGHNGGDGSSPFTRMNRYGNWQTTAGENIEYGSDTGLRSVIALIVDDGVPGRGHRKNIFNGDFRVAGVGTAAHARYRHVTVIGYAGGYEER